ncbi:MAG TPA: hypothetical protein VLU99_07745 [Nitrososphaerales archaeon]|nr:hypothetical protein [Nitrososphaerales archaeon]
MDKYGRRYADESSPAAGHNWWMLLDEFNISVPEYSRILVATLAILLGPSRGAHEQTHD